MIAATAHDYIDRGLSIVPLHPGAKTPMGRWRHWTQERMTHEQVDNWWGAFSPRPNLGVVTGTISGSLTVIDIEPEHVPYVRDAVKLPNTSHVTTARGGLHLYCRGDRPCGKARINGRIIGDIRGNGGYVVAPPSLIGAGAYQGELDLNGLAPLPDWLVELRQRRVSPPVLARRPIADLEAWLPSSVFSMLDGWRSHGCSASASELDFRVICVCVRVGASKESTLGMLGRHRIGENVLAHLRRDPSYFDRTYDQATSEIEAERERAIPMRCTRVRLYPGTLTEGARLRAQLTYTTDEGPATYTIPVILGRAPYEGDISGEWRALAAVYGKEPVPNATLLDGREVFGVCEQGRVIQIWEGAT